MVKHKYQTLNAKQAYRLVNSKFPPESLFDDVADEQEFDAIYAIQALTNPRIQHECGNIALLSKGEIPFGIQGVNYATAPFTHINPDGSRFSDGTYGMLYAADTIQTAIAETKYHQEKAFQNIVGLHYDTVIMRGIAVSFSGKVVNAINNEAIHVTNDYTNSRIFGNTLRKNNELGIYYKSVRNEGAFCWGLFSPSTVHSAIQTKHFEFVYNGKCISSVREISIVTSTT
ncbi:RES family NAD+ phosphorylase [Pseudocolwellia sp. HL-MZ19]|uniref:RES family NAD+ phosphorylase n=1 Tax=unclassified Pseudocolwellia TaxID=2848178 RepID=UPI003CF25C8D